jgi:hypothetical protein
MTDHYNSSTQDPFAIAGRPPDDPRGNDLFLDRLANLRGAMDSILDEMRVRRDIYKSTQESIGLELERTQEAWESLPFHCWPRGSNPNIDQVREHIGQEKFQLKKERRGLAQQRWKDVQRLKTDLAELVQQYNLAAEKTGIVTGEAIPRHSIQDLLKRAYEVQTPKPVEPETIPWAEYLRLRRIP